MATQGDVKQIPTIVTRGITVPYTCPANQGQYNTNLGTLIDADLPSGYKCLGIVGYTMSSQFVAPVALRYVNHAYSFQVKSVANTQISETATVLYLAMKE